MPDAEKIIAEALRAEGLDTGGASPHSWRCEHPDRYPDYCHCTEEAASVVADALRQAGMLTETEWEYGIASFGDSADVMQKPATVGDKTDREWAEDAIQREYGDQIVRRRKPGPWEPVEGDPR